MGLQGFKGLGFRASGLGFRNPAVPLSLGARSKAPAAGRAAEADTAPAVLGFRGLGFRV